MTDIDTTRPAAARSGSRASSTGARPSRARRTRASAAPAAAAPAPPQGRVVLVGTGPGDPGLLTVRAAELLGRAAVVVADADVPDAVLDLAPATAVVHRLVDDAGTPLDPAEVAGRVSPVALEAGPDHAVLRLVHGDPALLGSWASEAAALRAAGVRVEVVPGLPPALTAPTYAGIPLTTAAVRGVQVVDASASGAPDWAHLATSGDTLVLSDPGTGLGKAAASLVEHGLGGDTPVAVVLGATTPLQRTVVSTLDGVEADLRAALTPAKGAGKGVPVPPAEGAVAVVGEVVRTRDELSWFETRPLFRWRVLVPRTRAQAGGVAERLRALGAEPVEVPTIAVEPPRSGAAMDRALKGLVQGRYEWVAFTSTNAVKAVREKVEEFGLDARAFAGLKIAAVGDATAAALRGWGITPELVPSGEQSSEGLVAEWPERDEAFDPIGRVLLPRADIATETLAAGLVELGWEVDDVTAYRTVRAAPPPAPVRDAIKKGEFDAVLFTSSSTVKNLVGIAGKPHQTTVLAAIGPKTAESIEEQGLVVGVQAEQPSVASLVDALARAATARRAAGEPLPSEVARARRPKNAK